MAGRHISSIYFRARFFQFRFSVVVACVLLRCWVTPTKASSLSLSRALVGLPFHGDTCKILMACCVDRNPVHFSILVEFSKKHFPLRKERGIHTLSRSLSASCYSVWRKQIPSARLAKDVDHACSQCELFARFDT